MACQLFDAKSLFSQFGLIIKQALCSEIQSQDTTTEFEYAQTAVILYRSYSVKLHLTMSPPFWGTAYL